MNKLRDKLDPKYTKICIYAGATVIATVVALLLVYASGGFWKTLWVLFCAMLKPLIIGSIICYLLFPLVKKVEHGISKSPTGKTRILAILICLVAIIVVIAVLLIALLVAVNKGISSIDFGDLEHTITSIVNSLEEDYNSVMQSLEDQLSASLKNFPVSKVTGIINGIVGGVVGLFSSLLFGVIFAIYFMLDWDNIKKYWGRALNLICGERQRKSLEMFMHDADRVFSGYIRGQFIDAIIVGFGSALIFSLAGIPYGALVGVCVGVGNLIPYVGPIVGYVSLFIVCFISGAWTELLIGIVIMMVIMFVDGNIINPKLLSENVEVHPLLVMVALIGGGAISGFLGMVVAVPIAALLKLQFDRYLSAKEKVIAEGGETNVVDDVKLGVQHYFEGDADAADADSAKDAAADAADSKDAEADK